jgi:hypothetical protein
MLELRNVANVLSGVAVRETAQGAARFVRLSDLSELKAGRRPALACGEAPAVARALTIEEGDVLVGARGAATDVCLANSAIFGAFVSLDLYLVRPNKTRVNSQFLATFLELPSTQTLLASGKQGSDLARLPKDALEKTKVPLPSLHTQSLIAGLALAVETESKLLRNLTDLKASLGREAVAGAIRAASAHGSSPRSHA